MTKIASSILALTLAFGSAVSAGGPVVVEEEGQPEVVAESPRSGWIVPVIIGGIIRVPSPAATTTNSVVD